MAIEIKYINLLGNDITQQQAQIVGEDYSAQQYVDNQLKKVEHFEGNTLDNGEYFLSPDETLTTVLNEYKSVWNWGIFYSNSIIFGIGTLIKNWQK
jgi:hypothetical protein